MAFIPHFDVYRDRAEDVLKGVPECEMQYNFWMNVPTPHTEEDSRRIHQWVRWLMENTTCGHGFGPWGLIEIVGGTPERPPQWMLEPPTTTTTGTQTGSKSTATGGSRTASGTQATTGTKATGIGAATSPPAPPPLTPQTCSGAHGVVAPILGLNITCIKSVPTTLGIKIQR